MRHSPRAALLLCALLLLAACASGGGARPSGRSDTITREQIESTQFTNAYDLVAALRGQWLQKRGPDSINNPGEILVYLDDQRYGLVDALRTLPTSQVEYIRFYNGVEASARWGLGHGNGVIYVKTRLR